MRAYRPNRKTERCGRSKGSELPRDVARPHSLPGRSRGFPPTPPTDPYVKNSLIRFVSNGPGGPRTLQLMTPQGDMTVAAIHSHSSLLDFVAIHASFVETVCGLKVPPAFPWLISTTIRFSEFNDAACVLALPLLRTPPLSGRTSVRLPTRWLAPQARGRVGLDGFRYLTHWVTLTCFKRCLLYSHVPSLARREQARC